MQLKLLILYNGLYISFFYIVPLKILDIWELVVEKKVYLSRCWLKNLKLNKHWSCYFSQQVGFLLDEFFFSLGYSKPLDLEEIPSLVSEDEANMAYQKFVHAWESLVRERERNNNTKSLVLWSIVRTYLGENILIAFYGLIRTVSFAVSPLILYAFVNYSNRTEPDLRQGLSIVGVLIVTKVCESLSQRHWFFNSRRSGLKMRSALMVQL
ncbi:unnamed protein product [Vicia faba]|uniref:Uncharacterized protein n=1 Tax=Vicia faba TaxID=3906 RepID=A0AAV0ZZ04_VICFA|nr:unnamed protein product [Vicia faba]